MKRLLTAAVAVTLASSALAGNSDRYHDNRFDSAVGHVTQDATLTPAKPALKVSYSTSDSKKPSYPYINPYGIGPNNDSR